MSNTPPTRDGAPAVVMPQRRQVIRPGADMRRRTGLMFLGLVLVIAAAFAFWFILQSVDNRQPYLVAARTIKRFEIVQVSDFTVVNADVGAASAMSPGFAQRLVGQWAVGTIPAHTLVTPGMFGSPPLSGEDDAGSVLIEVSLPADEAAYGTLEPGDRVALIGSEPTGFDTGPGSTRVGLIGVLELETVQDGKLYYIKPPSEALKIESIVRRYENASDRRIWKLGTQVEEDELKDALDTADSLTPGLDGFFADEFFAEDGADPAVVPSDSEPLEPAGEQ